MLCAYCSSPTSVVNSRHKKRSNTIWRRRRCDKCKAIFTTREKLELASSVAFYDQNGQIQPFMQEKLLISLYESLRHRPSALPDASALTETVLGGLISPGNQSSALDRQQVIEAVLSVLENFDQAAWVYYKAYHPY